MSAHTMRFWRVIARDVDAWHDLGRMLAAHGDHARALECFERFSRLRNA